MAEKKKKAETMNTAPAEDNLLRGITRSGIEFTIDKRIKDDARAMRYMTMMQNKSLDTFKQSEALFSLLELMFGAQEGLTIFMNEVAAHHNGVADVRSLIEELSDMFASIKLKNS